MKRRPSMAMVIAMALVLPFAPLGAQSAADYVAQGNAASVARNAPEALAQYDRALVLDPHNYEALWKAARSGVNLGEFELDAARRTGLFRTAEQRARLAVQVDSADADGHFVLALALGRTALSLGKRDQVRYATAVREQAMRCLAIEANHAGCLHIMGEWNAEIMRLSGLTRMMAVSFLGGKAFDQASWANAHRYMEAAVNAEPRRITHRLDLARVYADMGLKQQARTQFQAVVNGELIDYNDPHYKAEAAAALTRL